MERRNGKAKRTAGYTILIVPKDDRPTMSLDLSPGRLRLLKIAAVVLGVHVLAGFVLYAVSARLYQRNHELEWNNRLLTQQAKRVEQVAAQFAELERSDRRIRALLGLQKDVGLPIAPKGTSPGSEALPPVGHYSSTSSGASEPIPVGPQELNYLMDRPSSFHFLLRNIPTLLPVEGYLTADYAVGLDAARPHYGIDIAAKKGTVVRAAGDGLIVFANWTVDLGNLVIIYHGDGLFSYYGHNERILKPIRTWVRKGEPIAILGSSGRSSGPHLHFEIWKDGQPQDPKQYLLAFAAQAKAKAQVGSDVGKQGL